MRLIGSFGVQVIAQTVMSIPSERANFLATLVRGDLKYLQKPSLLPPCLRTTVFLHRMALDVYGGQIQASHQARLLYTFFFVPTEAKTGVISTRVRPTYMFSFVIPPSGGNHFLSNLIMTLTTARPFAHTRPDIWHPFPFFNTHQPLHFIPKFSLYFSRQPCYSVYIS